MNFLDLSEDSITHVLSFLHDNVTLPLLLMTNNKLYTFVSKYGRLHFGKNILRQFSCDDVAENGYLGILKWLRTNMDTTLESTSDMYHTKKSVSKWTDWSFALAAGGGYNDMLEYMFDNECLYDERSFEEAARYGHFNTIKWLRTKFTGDNFLIMEDGYFTKNPNLVVTCEVAAENGHLEILKWLIEYDCPIDVQTVEAAAAAGHIHILSWIKDNMKQWSIVHDCLNQMRPAWSFFVGAAAAGDGKLDVLKWAKDNECDWQHNNTFSQAAGYGNLEILKWMKDNGATFYFKEYDFMNVVNGIYTNAALHNQIHVMSWLKENGCPIEESVSRVATQFGNLEPLKWAVKNGFPWNPQECLNIAERCGYDGITIWIKENIKN